MKPRRSSNSVLIAKLSNLRFDQLEALIRDLQLSKPGLAALIKFHLDIPTNTPRPNEPAIPQPK